MDLGLTQAQLDGLRHSLIAVVERGTAAASRRRELAVAGKTGTAQNSHGKDHGWFIGFAPALKPQLLIGVVVDEPHGAIYGGQVAAPAFGRIASFALPYLRIPPG